MGFPIYVLTINEQKIVLWDFILYMKSILHKANIIKFQVMVQENPAWVIHT